MKRVVDLWIASYCGVDVFGYKQLSLFWLEQCRSTIAERSLPSLFF